MPDDQQNQKTVVVLGAGGSGTSLIAGLLNILGVDMGEVLTEGKKNPKGFFENKKFVELNKKILKAASWHLHETNRSSADRILSQKKNFEGTIKNLIQQEFSMLWGWKDPRTSFTVELYLPYLTNPHFIICLRNPLNIALSLDQYGRGESKIKIEDYIRSTNFYNKVILDFLGKYPELPRIFVSFENVVSNPTAQFLRLAKFLGIKPSSEQIKKANKFVIPRNKIKRARINYLVKKGMKKPWRIPLFIYRRIRI